ncbi:hypothetical protein NGA_0459800, partial [Nannochloropsis gaditana CCMP526]|uniref:uncharacterized protein n=1 Tax=Nannochloropsis gaditana (strain CCMP526) TaxID=1093141 RepID=UPI00029F54C4
MTAPSIVLTGCMVFMAIATPSTPALTFLFPTIFLNPKPQHAFLQPPPLFHPPRRVSSLPRSCLTMQEAAGVVSPSSSSTSTSSSPSSLRLTFLESNSWLWEIPLPPPSLP